MPDGYTGIPCGSVVRLVRRLDAKRAADSLPAVLLPYWATIVAASAAGQRRCRPPMWRPSCPETATAFAASFAGAAGRPGTRASTRRMEPENSALLTRSWANIHFTERKLQIGWVFFLLLIENDINNAADRKLHGYIPELYDHLLFTLIAIALWLLKSITNRFVYLYVFTNCLGRTYAVSTVLFEKSKRFSGLYNAN